MSPNDVIWRKSSYSSNNDYGECVEVAAPAPDFCAVRDSKAIERGHLHLRPTAWSTFLTALRT
ncbi:DUF397 domain-containing protein [Yinghuangia sp. YIM S09857]|uniref:DUF397 domain-containing protein n=1 Tax=Yinghuangia sp. YIM S09857 TaxID=3436929 RepID=UPI003F52B6DB